jgi:hypothetical protein
MKRYRSLLIVFMALAAFAVGVTAQTAETASAEVGASASSAKPVLIGELAQATASKPTAVPAGEVILLDNFEDGNYWAAVGSSWDQWGAHNLSLEAELNEKWGTDGKTSSYWVFDMIPAKGGQATFFCDQLIETNWTGAKYIVLDVNNPGPESFTMCFSCQTTDGWKWTQTPTVEVMPGVSTVVYDLTKDLKDGANASVPKIDGIDQMKRAMFNVMTYGKNGGSGNFSVDNIRLIK